MTLRSSCNSLVWAAGHDGSQATNVVPAPGQSLVNLMLDERSKDTFWTQAVDAPTTGATTVLR